MPPALVDFVFSEKLFVHFLVNGCVASSPEHEVLSNVVNGSPWPEPVGVRPRHGHRGRGGFFGFGTGSAAAVARSRSTSLSSSSRTSAPGTRCGFAP